MLEGKGEMWEGAEILRLPVSCFSIKSVEGELSLHKAYVFLNYPLSKIVIFPQKKHFLSSHFCLLVLLITRDAPIFALFALLAVAQVQRCCWGAAALPCW